MQINIYSIGKSDEFSEISDEILKSAKQFGANISIFDIHNKEIIKAQKISPKQAQNSYTQALEKYTNAQICISLHPNAKELDSHGFAKLIEDKNEINFFIGGAYGFESEFLKKTTTLSLSKLTMSHKIAKIVLCEQIFRALSIINNHPYHK